ncbi:DUF2502 domain-containing protein [Cupriavidus plantarum]|uniref:DUF2502 domain-containing protein n=1 Tax=Cupriavidus plantarum TaxID=942865 RepID=UPI00339D9E3B
MKKTVLAGVLACSAWTAGAADVNVAIGTPGMQGPAVVISFGSRDSRGYYWDGEAYRDPAYWRKHNGPKGEKYYTGRGKGNGGCPPGQAKKARC